jgi:hypothetical protein
MSRAQPDRIERRPGRCLDCGGAIYVDVVEKWIEEDPQPTLDVSEPWCMKDRNHKVQAD